MYQQRYVIFHLWKGTKRLAVMHLYSSLPHCVSIRWMPFIPSLFVPFFSKPPAQPEWLQVMSDSEVEISSELLWGCVAAGKPRPSIRWLRNGHPLTTQVSCTAYCTIYIHTQSHVKALLFFREYFHPEKVHFLWIRESIKPRKGPIFCHFL